MLDVYFKHCLGLAKLMRFLLHTAPLIYSWSAGNTAGETKKKVTTGIMIVGQCAGNV